MAIDKDFVIKNGLQVNENLVFADPDTNKVGIGTTEANRKLVVIGDGEVSQSLAVGTTITAERIAVTGVSTAQSGLDVGIGGTVITASVLNKQIGINSTNPTYTLDLRGPVSTGTTAAFIFGDVEVTGTIKGASLSGQISAGGTVGFTNVTVDNKLIANNAEVFTKFNIDDNSNKFRFLAAGDPPGIGFTQNKDNPEIYLQRGQNYRFVVDAGGFPFYIKTEPTADLLNQFNRGVENNGAQVGIITFKVPFDSPNKLYYQASNIAGMGGSIFIGNDQKTNSIGVLTVTSFLDSNTQADFEQIFVSGIGTINNLKGPDFSVSSGIVTVRQDQTALIGVSTGSDKLLIEKKGDNTSYQVMFTENNEDGYAAGYIDSETLQFRYNPQTQELAGLVNVTATTFSGIATGADNINVDQKNDNVDYQVIFSDTDGSAYQRLYIDTNNTNLTYNPSTNTLTSTNVNATTFTGSLSGTATNANNINVDEKNDNTDYQVLFSDNQGNSFQRPYIDSNSGQFKYNPSTQTLTAGNIAGAGDNITNLDGSNISQGTIDADRIPDASTTAQGVVQLDNTPDSSSTTTAPTSSALKQVFETALGIVPAGSVMLFYQSAAPTGWTKITTQNNKSLRVVSGTGGGTGGNLSFTSTFDNRSVVLPQHNHTANLSNQTANHTHEYSGDTGNQSSNHTHGGNTTSNGSHAHNISDPGHNHSYVRRTADNVEHGDRSNTAAKGLDSNSTTGNRTTGISVLSSGSGHQHNLSTGGNSANHKHEYSGNTGASEGTHKHNITIQNEGTSGATMDFRVQYIDVLICSKD